MTADLRYPIGPLAAVAPASADVRLAAIANLVAAPLSMRAAVSGLSDAQLDTPYRPGGWTVRQVVHHVPDSHMHAYIRLKFALTGDAPTIKPFNEQTWAELADSRMPIELSLGLLDGIHARMVTLFRALASDDWARTFHHPEYPDAPRTLDWLAQGYAWHSRHHIAHITSLRQREGWLVTP
jgi:hypothetical protein